MQTSANRLCCSGVHAVSLENICSEPNCAHRAYCAVHIVHSVQCQFTLCCAHCAHKNAEYEGFFGLPLPKLNNESQI